MPKLDRSAWYDLTRDMNWKLKYVQEDEAFPQDLSNTFGVAHQDWWEWDEPYKINFREYLENQADKDISTYSVKSAIARSRLFDMIDPGWKAAIIAHYGAISMPEYTAAIGEARMGRFGRAAACRCSSPSSLKRGSPTCQVSRDWSKALTAYALERAPEHRELLRTWVARWSPLAYGAVTGLAPLLGQAPRPLDPVAAVAEVRSAHESFLQEIGLA